MDTPGRRAAPDDSPEAHQIRSLMALVGERLLGKAAVLNRSMNAAIEREVEDLDDPVLAAMLHASVEGNITTILQGLRNDIPVEHIETSTAAKEYAIRLAQLEVPASSLRRAYHIGSDDLLAFMFDEVQGLESAPELKLKLLYHLSNWLHRYVDQITRTVIAVHEEERRFRFAESADVRASLIRRVLGGQPVGAGEFSAQTGYSLAQVHIAAIISLQGANPGVDHVEALTSVAREIARKQEVTALLITPADRTALWVWFGREDDETPMGVTGSEARFVRDPRLRVAFGSPRAGMAGFRQSHEQAVAIRHVAMLAGTAAGRLLRYGDEGVSTVAVLARDLLTTRRWVHEVLGPLARNTEAAERLRQTLRAFLTTGGSYTETAKLLVLHRNSVKYRVEQAERQLGRALDDGRLDLQLALQVFHLLGASVLQP